MNTHLSKVLHHLYINPLEKCNLKCKICYTKKTDPILSEKQIMSFVDRYQLIYELKMITFCGGEVFALPYFPDLINTLNKRGIFIQTITNGTIDYLDKIEMPNLNNLIVSIDGLEEYHDSNRGKGNFKKSTLFLKKARKLGFHTELFSIVTKQNFSQIDMFEEYLKKEVGEISVTYHPRKPPAYLTHHPISNIEGEVNGFDYLSADELVEIMTTRNVFPPKDLGCYQIALASSGIVYGCCEGYRPIGKMEDSIEDLFTALEKRIGGPCLGCSQTEFMCGIKTIIDRVQSKV
ncbi:MAG: radical SAM protein [Candidatus Roizmanbacteria bacterium]|nr:radical SAM protein [Candidatus Roizmanbacteria bacterium]